MNAFGDLTHNFEPNLSEQYLSGHTTRRNNEVKTFCRRGIGRQRKQSAPAPLHKIIFFSDFCSHNLSMGVVLKTIQFYAQLSNTEEVIFGLVG